MGVPNHNLDALEEQRLALEENILQLEKSLYHWRTWEAEYDGVREEISNLDDDASTEDFLAVASEFGGTLVDEKEMHTILGAQGVTRSRGQVVDLLGRRIDYVKQNVSTMEKRLRKAQDERDVYMSDLPAAQPAADFPMQEIMEELDEDGNVVSSSVNAPGNQASELLQMLEKAGVKDISETETDAQEKPVAPEPKETVEAGAPGSSKAPETQQTPSEQNAVSQPDNVPVNGVNVIQHQSLVTDEDRKVPPVTDVDESLEEAKLRREMLEYGINEVGAIVAELEMDESGSDISFDEEYDYDDDYEEDEDEHGRSRTRLPADYHKEMIELEARLNARGLMNMGKDTETFPEEVQQEIEAPAEVSSEPSVKEKKPKKRVAFAEDLDIAPAQAPPAPAEKITPPQDEPPVLADAVVERSSRSQDPESSTAPSVPKKTSRFKAARANTSASEPVTTGATFANPSQITESRLRKQANSTPSAAPPALFPATPQEPKPFSAPISDIVEKPVTPQPPQDRTLAENVLERNIRSGTAKAPELDHYDEEFHQKQIASEFFRMQQRMNPGQKEEEPQVLPPDSEEPPKRVSKFKASRLG
ncbi:unnamed protein product [Penicillium salamii]|uniref:DUF3835 domain-containing protein n=1 Tax=Penicillium salamii TaxID=1612424 RepID=A0A9W4IJL2_9EURO|nr:unnamed protein product [Penicillium salamii]CAG8010747.1 unnamed protein product [Penicillium salamii]CAG8068232.1 unnamed protein product [Penicillium salamii]CAG8251901.1 unnamed protein product [Penicillium salamii]CAG8310732.1 unnamed protein product [Penicillium salamii]